MIELLPGIIVLATILGLGALALWHQGDLDDVLHGHRCSEYCRPGAHVTHPDEEADDGSESN